MKLGTTIGLMSVSALALTVALATSAFAGGTCGMKDANYDKAKAKAKGDIVDIAASSKDFSTLVAAVKAAGLVETLKGDGPFTVFAPTNEAFAKLPEGTVESLLKPENRDKLIAVLTYHVVPGKVMAKDVVSLSEAKTVQGTKVEITVKDDKVMINKSQVTKTDINATNGVIHVIDTVLLPSG